MCIMWWNDPTTSTKLMLGDDGGGGGGTSIQQSILEIVSQQKERKEIRRTPYGVSNRTWEEHPPFLYSPQDLPLILWIHT